MEEKLLDCVQREVEACDRVSSFFALHSVAGGTGSGLGSFALQAVHDAYAGVPIVASCVWPFEGGEVSVQSYNAALSLATAYDTADMILLCENERYMEICQLALRERSHKTNSLAKLVDPRTPHKRGRSFTVGRFQRLQRTTKVHNLNCSKVSRQCLERISTH
eukprot:295306-Amphidinium_carterae.1